MTERAAPFYCPYCGDEDLRPASDQPRLHDCASCGRRFELKFVGISRLPASTPNKEGAR